MYQLVGPDQDLVDARSRFRTVEGRDGRYCREKHFIRDAQWAVQLNRMLLRLRNVPTSFQGSMNIMLAMGKRQQASVYINDIIIYSTPLITTLNTSEPSYD